MEVLASASEGLMGALAEKLRSLLGSEYALQAGVRDDIDFLQSELQRMHAFLQDYERCQATTAVVKDWAREVQELAYDLEDAVDDFRHRVGPVPVGIPAKVLHFVSTLMARRQIAEQARSLRARALEVSERHKRYEHDLPLPADAPSSSTMYAEVTNQSNLVGIDGPRDEIIGKLMDAGRKDVSCGRRRVAAMVGFAGVGKTTLAMSVYRSLEGRFQCRAFVTVSRKFVIKRLLADILQQFIPIGSVETWEVSQLVGKLRQSLQDKRYLIVIDDLWETSAWRDISCVLPENNLGSIILITTRNESVADACCSSCHLGDFVHKVASMNDLDSKTLFLGRIFGSLDNCPHDLEEVSMKILKKCAGLPLAIVCISSLLAATRPQVTKWEKIYNSLGSEIESNDSLSRLKQALQLGYEDLPQHLKVCVLYLCSFPGNCKIERDRLTRRWVAEGFVAEKPRMSLQEVAESYFSELIERTMIQAVDVDCFGEVHACRIHDVMFELIMMKSFEDNFVTLVGDRWGLSPQRRNVRRLSLYCRTATDGLELLSFDLPHVRSFTIYGDIRSFRYIPRYKFLRMLDFECCEGVRSRHLNNIGNLLLLKYLSLKGTWISELPSQIGNLKCLETLDLTQTNVRELPKEITQLQRLVHLLAGGAELPGGIGNVMSLQTLCIRAASKRSKEAVNELLRLTNLRQLDISYMHLKVKGRSQYERLDACLPLIIGKLGNCDLQSLNLNLLGYSMGLFLELQLSLSAPPYTLKSLKIKGEHGFLRVPMWISSLAQLNDLELTIAAVGERDTEILAELPRLIRLRLALKEPSAQGIIIRGSGFPSLKELYINCRIMPVFFGQGVMPKLQKFELQFLAYQEDLRSVLLSTGHLQSLKEFRFAVVCKGLSDPDIEFLKEAFKSAVFI
ncbi:unnamed protein product [Urochloa decumbens]|uniref:Uncharacterized protein n=1 Tax=Urochloa decumbens TaxID=240449 RepID=A0ABC9GBR6_9POAL